VERRAWDAVIDVLPGLDAVVTEGRLDVARDALRDYDKCLAGRVLRAAAARAGIPLGPRASSRVVAFASTAASGRRVAVGGGLEAEVAFGRLRLSRPTATPGAVALFGARGGCDVGRHHLAWRAARAPQRSTRGGWSAWFTTRPALVRPLAEGDRLVPLGGVGRRKVSRLLMEAKVPRSERTAYPVVVGRSGEVLWVPGVCRGSADVPKPGTRAVRVDVTVR
jgi:tRNA(Ile)-lysidine synthetase-like protein